MRANNNEICSAATSATLCNFSLTTGYITGTVNLVTDPPPGNSVVVQVLAENSGSNQLVSALPQPLVFVNHETSQPFMLNVPISGAGPNFDLLAVAIDPFQGGPNPFSGHDIPVLANVTGPTGCSPSIPAPAFAAMDCVGHGSISGTVQNPDTGTSVEVEKLDPNNTLVQIFGTLPALFSSTSPSNIGNNAYTLCVPPDNYALQRFEAPPTPTSTPTSSAEPTPSAESTPSATVTATPISGRHSTSGDGSAAGRDLVAVPEHVQQHELWTRAVSRNVQRDVGKSALSHGISMRRGWPCFYLCALAAVTLAILPGCNQGLGAFQQGVGNTPNKPPLSAFRILGQTGMQFSASVSTPPRPGKSKARFR